MLGLLADLFLDPRDNEVDDPLLPAGNDGLADKPRALCGCDTVLPIVSRDAALCGKIEPPASSPVDARGKYMPDDVLALDDMGESRLGEKYESWNRIAGDAAPLLR